MLKVGIFGVGHLGKFHVSNWKDIAGVMLMGFYDPDDKVAQIITEKYQINRFNSPEELILAVDIVDIVTPTTSHFDLCKKAILAGKHVFVEKPITRTIAEAKELVKMVKEANVKLQVGHIERFNPAFKAVQHIAFNPRFIEVHRLSQFNQRGTEVSVILDLMIHDIDIILHLVDSPIKDVFATGISVLTDTPDIANARLSFDNGCVVNLTSSRISLKKMRKMRIFQKSAYIGIDFLERRTEIVSLKDQSFIQDADDFSFEIDTVMGKKNVHIQSPTIPIDANPMKDELMSFRDAICLHKPTSPNEMDGLLALELAHIILDKMQMTI